MMTPTEAKKYFKELETFENGMIVIGVLLTLEVLFPVFYLIYLLIKEYFEI